MTDESLDSFEADVESLYCVEDLAHHGRTVRRLLAGAKLACVELRHLRGCLVTEEFLAQGTSGRGMARRQAHILGLTFPLVKGWKAEAVGKRIPVDEAEEFLSLRGD